MSDNLNECKLWLEKADSDLGAAKILLVYLPEYKEAVAFHCQQAVEKYLKAYLIFLDIEFKPSHNLVYLINQINTKDSTSDSYYPLVIKFEGFAVEFRYPNATIMPTDEELKEAIQITETIRKWITDKIL